nr:gamma-glutamyl peptidase 5-like [Ipomoea batatas]
MKMMKVEGEHKRYALLLATRDSDYVKKVYGGYLNVFIETLGEEGEIWDLFRVVDGDFPAMDDLHIYEGFVISGSPYDAYGNEPWILQLCLLLQALFSMQKKVLGICFGHQAYSGWDIGVRKVEIVKDLCFQFLGDDDNNLEETSPSLSIIEVHQDEIGFAEDVRAKILAAEPDRKCWEKICKTFLKGKVEI